MSATRTSLPGRLTNYKSTPRTDPTENMPSYYISITVLSNYGNPDRISCGEIDVLDATNRVIPVRDIQFEPQIQHYESPCHLVNSALIKEEGDKEWSAKWEGPFTIQLMVKTDVMPTNLRIWNSRMKTDECIKDVKVTLGEVFLRDATVPNNFGFVISLKTNSDMEKIQHIPGKPMRNHDDTAADRFGEFPIRRASKITIGIIDTWEEASEFVGLNALKIVSIAGKVLSLEVDIKSVESNNCDSVSSPQRLFRSDTRISSAGDIWLARKLQGRIPEVTIEFREPVRLAMITLSNALVRDFMQDFSAKRIRISVDSVPVFYGNLKRAFSIEAMETSVKAVYFTDAPQLRRKAKVALMSAPPKL